jgi:uncharacterized membrane protein
VLAAFFISSNLVSRLPLPAGPSVLDAKTDRRDVWQVYANGGVAALAGGFGLRDGALGIWLVTAALAAAAADTWATSLGGRSRAVPRLPWSGRLVPAGTSGGMTLLGTAGAAGGALIVACTGAIVAGMPILLPVGTLIGFFGMVADSTLGAFLQGRFHCPVCEVASEWRVHRCGARTQPQGGVAWLDNDGVNFLATALAAAGALIAWYWVLPP